MDQWRSVRDGRFKFIISLLPARPSPSTMCYSGPGKKWEPGAAFEEIAAGGSRIRRAYDVFAHPPPEELYDLEKDPWEFKNLAGDREHALEQDRLPAQLRSWQETTGYALLDPCCLDRLTVEHDYIAAAYYPDAWGTSREYEWRYSEYLHKK